MKYIEYVYLILAGMVLLFLATDFEDLPRRTVIYLLIAMGIFSFMFAFRRSQRLRFERFEAEELARLAELEPEDEEEEENDPQAPPSA